MDFRSWAFLAALFAFAAVFVGRERVFSRLKEYEEEKQKKREYVPALSLVLEMIAVAVGQGASIPRALEAISHSMPGVFSQFAGEIVSVLYKGGDWAGAWAVVPGNCPYRAIFDALRDVLEPSWRHGISPMIRIESAVEQIGRDEKQAVAQASGRLSVKVLMPVGLCFLPAFILISVVPSIASWAGELF